MRKFNFLLKNKINYKIGKRRNSDIIISIANPNKLIKERNWRPKFNNLAYAEIVVELVQKKCQRKLNEFIQKIKKYLIFFIIIFCSIHLLVFTVSNIVRDGYDDKIRL